jgi:hypothetical protein
VTTEYCAKAVNTVVRLVAISAATWNMFTLIFIVLPPYGI